MQVDCSKRTSTRQNCVSSRRINCCKINPRLVFYFLAVHRNNIYTCIYNMTYPHSTIDDIYTKHNNPISIIHFTTSTSSEYYTFESRIFKESSCLIFRLFFGGYQHIIENIMLFV